MERDTCLSLRGTPGRDQRRRGEARPVTAAAAGDVLSLKGTLPAPQPPHRPPRPREHTSRSPRAWNSVSPGLLGGSEDRGSLL